MTSVDDWHQERLRKVGPRVIDDAFLVVGVSSRRREREIMFERIRSLGRGPTEIMAPVETKVIRPRRKSSKKKPLDRQSAIFFEYIGVEFAPLAGTWQQVLHLDGVWFVLRDGEGPALVSRDDLGGLLAADSVESWEGKEVLFTAGPFANRVGIYRAGKIELLGMDRTIIVEGNLFDLTKL